jgi:AsmA protein
MFTKAAQTLRRQASRPFGRVLLFSALLMVALAVGFRILTPFLISTATVQQSMERAVADWTGHGATIGGVSTIRFWPHPEVTISDITIRGDEDGGSNVLATIDELSASFELTEALLGQPVFRDFRLVNPHAFVNRDQNGRLHWANDGRLIEAISKAVVSGSGQALDEALDVPIGEVEISNGVIDIVGDEASPVTRFEAIHGTLDWPRLSDAADIDATFTFQDRRISLDVNSNQPLLLLDGRSGHFQGTATSDIGLARFDGVASIAPGGYFSGYAETQVSDMPAMLRWLGINPAIVEGLSSASVAARVIADKSELRLENLSLGLNNENATGLLEFDMPPEGQSRLSGTLAFDRIDAMRLLMAMEPAIGTDTDGLPSLFKGLGLDLRLSSQTATFGAVQLSEVALGIMNVGEQFRLDILDSALQPGRVTGRISTSKADGRDSVALRLAIRGADFAALARQLQVSGPFPATQGTLDISLDVPRPLHRDTLEGATGQVQFAAGAGQFNGIDLPTIRRLAAERAYFSLGEAANGSLEFQSITASAVLGNGIADIRSIEIKGPTETISLAGAVPLVSRSFALSATVQPTGTPAGQPLGLFVGGAWPNPVLHPASTPASQPRE